MDGALAIVAVLLAAAFLVRRFTGPRQPPSCAPDAKAQPQVIVGAKLARAMKGAKRE